MNRISCHLSMGKRKGRLGFRYSVAGVLSDYSFYLSVWIDCIDKRG